ncbi:MAG: ligase-associated DNA damage response endonuclease PdeM [Saprospiraceae bacterium]
MSTIFCISGATLHLHPFRAAFWEEERTLLLADLHLGKAAHFRREGIPAPVLAEDGNFDRLMALLLELRPERVIILGDLFHSHYNPVWEEVGALLRQFEHLRFELVAGNHDLLSEYQYQKTRLEVHAETLNLGPFIFSHHPLEEIPEGLYNLAGHIHPSVRLRGAGMQRERLPCFYFGERQGLLPAFGAFTGTHPIKPSRGDRVFVLTGEGVMEV